MEKRTQIGILDMDTDKLYSIINALDDAVDEIGDVTIGAVADLMAHVCHRMDEPSQ